MRLLTDFFTRKHLIIVFFLTSFVVFSQRGPEYATNVSFIRNSTTKNQNGFDFTGVKFGHQFVNCEGIVQVGVNYSKTANFTNYWYNGKSYSKQTVGADLWPKSNEVEINTVQADLYFGNQNLGRVKLNYIVGNFAGCFGETYDVLKQVGKNSSLKEYKDNINNLRLQNIVILSARAIGLWREPKISNKLNLIQKQKEQGKINERVKYLVQEAARQNMVGNHKFAKQKYQEAYKLKPSKELLAQIKKTDDLILKKLTNNTIQTKTNEAFNFLNSNNYEAALSKFKEVYALKPSEDIKRQIQTIENRIKENNSKKTSSNNTTKNSSTKKTTYTGNKKNNSTKKTNIYTKPKTTYNPKLTTAQKSAINNAVTNYQNNIQRKLREQDRLYEKRRQEQLREEKKWQAEQRRERERRRKAAIEYANYQKYIKEQKERQRLAKIEEEKRFNNWIRNEKAKLDNQLANWNNDVLVFINSMDKSYSIGKVENSKDYFEKLTTTLDNILIAPNIPVLDKSIFIDDIINKTKGYQNIYSKYNYRNVIPEEIKNNLGKVYAYAKAHYGYHPAVQYEQTFTQKKEINKDLVSIRDIIKRQTLVKNAFKEGEVKIGIFEYISKMVNDEKYYGYIDNYKPQNVGSFSDDLNFGYLFYYNGDLDHAKAYLKKGLEYFEKNKIYSPEYFQAYSHLISVYTKKNYPKEFIVDIEIFEKRLKKAFDTNKLDKVYISKNTNMIYVDENLQQSYFRVLAHGYQRLESWNSIVKSKFKINNNSLIKRAKDMIKKSDNLYELGNAIEDLVSTLKYRDEKFYKKNLTDFKFKQNISANMKSEDLLTIIRDSYDAKDFELTEKLGKQFILNNSIFPSNYPDEINLAIRSAIFNGNFETGLTFAHYSLYRKKNKTRETSIRDTTDEKYVMLLINLIMLNKTQHRYLIYDQDNAQEINYNSTYYMQKDLTEFAAKQFDGVYGYLILEEIVKNFSEKKINSPAILYIYNAINEAKTKI